MTRAQDLSILGKPSGHVDLDLSSLVGEVLKGNHQFFFITIFFC